MAIRRFTGALMLAAMAAIVLASSPSIAATKAAGDASGKPTIVLVHGAFADSSSWDGVIPLLLARGYRVVAASNPLRGLAIDAAQVKDLVKSLPGKVVLVGHSYAGQVITAAGSDQVAALVYVDGFATDTGESAADIGNRFAGATLGQTLAPPVPLSDGGKDLYIQQALLPAQFAADVPAAKARLMAVEQRPVTEAALNDKLQGEPAWKHAPVYCIYGSGDKNIAPEALAFMAKRASSKKTVVVPGGSHVVMVSHPQAVANLIIMAAGGKP